MIKSVYVELDSILDTRLTFLRYLLEDRKTEKIEYWSRNRDNFGNIPSSVFHHYYKHRNKLILPESIHTDIVLVVSDMADDFLLHQTKPAEFKIYLNYYPYDLVFEERLNLTEQLKKMFINTEIELVKFDPFEKELKWFVNNVEAIIMYEGLRFLEYKAITGELLNNCIIDKMFITPYLLSGVSNDENISKRPITELLAYYKTIVDLKLLDIKAFNAKVSTIEEFKKELLK